MKRTGPLPADIELFDSVSPSFWQRIKYPLRWLGIASLVIVTVLLFRRYELAQYIDQAALKSAITPFGPWAPVAFIALFIALMLIVVIPFSVPCALGVLLFGVSWGTLWNVLGGTLAAMAVFGMSRWLGKGLIEKRAHDVRWQNLNHRLEQDGLYYLLLVRILSIVPFNLLNFAAAFTSIRWRDFVLANLVGLIPSAFLYGYGAKLLLDPNASQWALILLVGFGLLLVVTPLVFRQARRKRRQEQRRLIHEAFQSFK